MNLLCTVCSGVLEPTDYEGTPVMHCNQCQGYLVDRGGVDDIKESGDKSTAELAAEQDRERVGDTLDAIRCPRCGSGMVKEYLTEPDAFHVDYCDGCDAIWFDGGELARLQLTFEARRRGRERGRTAGGWRAGPTRSRDAESAPEEMHEEEPVEEAPAGEEEEGMFASFGNYIKGLWNKAGRPARRRKWLRGEE